MQQHPRKRIERCPGPVYLLFWRWNLDRVFGDVINVDARIHDTAEFGHLLSHPLDLSGREVVPAIVVRVRHVVV